MTIDDSPGTYRRLNVTLADGIAVVELARPGKANALDLLRDELPRKRVKGTVGTGSMNDPYMPLEAKLNLTGRALAIIADY
jgi:hypothetical protein